MSGGIGEVKELQAPVAGLVDRLDAIPTSLQKATVRLHQAESELVELHKRMDADISEDTVAAISAAVSTYLDNHSKVKAIRYDRHKTWAAQGRQIQQQRSLY